MDSRIHCDYKTLLMLQHQAQGFNFLTHQKAGSILAGRHQSRFRGRGLDFDALRHYRQGDDIRSLDWKVTLRTGSPHVRTYVEEKDREILLCIDQRISMFFASVETMKSVVAAHLGALAAWRVLAENDRVGALLFNDIEQFWFSPQRSQRQVFRILRQLSGLNTQLSIKNFPAANPNCFNDVLAYLYRMRHHDKIYLFFSDGSGGDSDSIALMKKLQQHNDVLFVLITDPMEQRLPEGNDLVISDGRLQMAVTAKDQKMRSQFEQQFRKKQQLLIKLMQRQKLPLIQVSTDGGHLQQFKAAFGGR